MSEFVRFFGVTVLGVVIDIAIAWALHTYASVPLWIAASCGFALAALAIMITTARGAPYALEDWNMATRKSLPLGMKIWSAASAACIIPTIVMPLIISFS